MLQPDCSLEFFRPFLHSRGTLEKANFYQSFTRWPGTTGSAPFTIQIEAVVVLVLS